MYNVHRNMHSHPMQKKQTLCKHPLPRIALLCVCLNLKFKHLYFVPIAILAHILSNCVRKKIHSPIMPMTVRFCTMYSSIFCVPRSRRMANWNFPHKKRWNRLPTASFQIILARSALSLWKAWTIVCFIFILACASLP